MVKRGRTAAPIRLNLRPTSIEIPWATLDQGLAEEVPRGLPNTFMRGRTAQALVAFKCARIQIFVPLEEASQDQGLGGPPGAHRGSD
ncbi:MAG: hypothetical protein DRJ61_09925 [Acidobacteria bacterium]|nr:MAG: hypothetical protein DRJ61_09925 [Acidobacteriota bacterium]